MIQQADLYQPIQASRTGPAPLVIRTVITAQSAMVMGGVPTNQQKIEPYVLLSALPDELKRRVELAVQALVSGG